MERIQAALHKVSSRKDLTEAEAVAVMNEILQGNSTPPLTAALLTALRMKGEKYRGGDWICAGDACQCRRGAAQEHRS